jgi:hypothetical protein
MGDIANDAITGFACSSCGVYFEQPHGHPVVCADCHGLRCWRERDGLPKATHAEVGDDTDDTDA